MRKHRYPKAENKAKADKVIQAIKDGSIRLETMAKPKGHANMFDIRIRKSWYMADTSRILAYFQKNPTSIVTVEKNTKLGKIATANQLPLTTCKAHVPCKEWCYALRGHWSFASSQLANWLRYMLYKLYPVQYFSIIADICGNGLPTPFFRWHSSGDIVDMPYLEGMVRIAKNFPSIKFLAFTKKYELVNEYCKKNAIPSNLRIVFSHCPGLEMLNPHCFPVVFVSGVGEDNIIPNDSIPCSGHCEGCFTCWLVTDGGSIVIKKHN